MAKRAIEKIGLVRHSPRILEEAKAQLADPSFTTLVVATILEAISPTYRQAKPPEFQVALEGQRLKVHTNIDFAAANESCNWVDPANNSLTPAHFLNLFLDVLGDLEFAANLGAEMAVEEVNARVIQMSLNNALARRGASQANINEFQEVLFADARAVARAVTNGEHTFKELLSVLANAHKFKDWLRDKPVDATLLKEYYASVTKSTWIDRLPVKAARWIILSGIGLSIDSLGAGGLGTAAGLAISAADAFIVDRLVKGWRPNQFVDGPLRGLVQPR